MHLNVQKKRYSPAKTINKSRFCCAGSKERWIIQATPCKITVRVREVISSFRIVVLHFTYFRPSKLQNSNDPNDTVQNSLSEFCSIFEFPLFIYSMISNEWSFKAILPFKYCKYQFRFTCKLLDLIFKIAFSWNYVIIAGPPTGSCS